MCNERLSTFVYRDVTSKLSKHALFKISSSIVFKLSRTCSIFFKCAGIKSSRGVRMYIKSQLTLSVGPSHPEIIGRQLNLDASLLFINSSVILCVFIKTYKTGQLGCALSTVSLNFALTHCF